ncbi:MAG: hypothetical protein KAZ14_00580 [Nitrosomonas sp.]|nr:hypothetical protein [Nitrosomonas sp.]
MQNFFIAMNNNRPHGDDYLPNKASPRSSTPLPFASSNGSSSSILDVFPEAEMPVYILCGVGFGTVVPLALTLLFLFVFAFVFSVIGYLGVAIGIIGGIAFWVGVYKDYKNNTGEAFVAGVFGGLILYLLSTGIAFLGKETNELMQLAFKNWFYFSGIGAVFFSVVSVVIHKIKF